MPRSAIQYALEIRVVDVLESDRDRTQADAADVTVASRDVEGRADDLEVAVVITRQRHGQSPSLWMEHHVFEVDVIGAGLESLD